MNTIDVLLSKIRENIDCIGADIIALVEFQDEIAVNGYKKIELVGRGLTYEAWQSDQGKALLSQAIEAERAAISHKIDVLRAAENALNNLKSDIGETL